MLGPVRNAQRLERDCKSEEHLKCSIKEFQPLQPTNQLHCQSVKCPCANTYSRGNKQKESEVKEALHACRAVILLASWRCSGMASVGKEGYRLFRKDRQGKAGGSVTPYVSGLLQCMEFHLGMDEEPFESRGKVAL